MAEAYVESLISLNYDEYGTEAWYRQHAYLDKLNLQVIFVYAFFTAVIKSVISARSVSDEYVKEFIVNHNKVPVLIQNLIATELWQQHIFKRVVKLLPDGDEASTAPSFPIYVVTYQQLVLANLLETVAYHVDIIDGLRDSAVDLCDWSHRALCRLISQTSTDDGKTAIRTLKDKVCLFHVIFQEKGEQKRFYNHTKPSFYFGEVVKSNLVDVKGGPN